MAARKLQQEVDKCFKRVQEGVAEFESIYEKIEQSTNAAQKEKLEDNLKKEIKKLQRLRDQIKTWAAANDIKDKGPLLENRKLIETQMEKFKAVEKAMKTKAYSKEGLSAAAKLDPKERAKLEACEFLSESVDTLERQIETLEAEAESIQATMKKGKNQSSKADRMSTIEHLTERHKWHQGKLELIKRSLENGGVETEQVNDLRETIQYYLSDGMNEDYMEDDEMYDELNLLEEEDMFGMNNEDKVSSQDTQSVQEELPDTEVRSNSIPSSKSKPDVPNTTTRRPSTQLKSPLPAHATLHTPLATMANGTPSMKPAALPTRAPGETLKYASAAAAAAASDKIGIAPLPPPPEALPPSNSPSNPPGLPSYAGRTSATASPMSVHAQPANISQTLGRPNIPAVSALSEPPSTSATKSPALSNSSAAPSGGSTSQAPPERPESTRPGGSRVSSGKVTAVSEAKDASKAGQQQTNGATNGVKDAVSKEADDSIFHLPPGLQDLFQCYENTQRRASSAPSQSSQRMLATSQSTFPDMQDIGPPGIYRPAQKLRTPSYYPQELDSIFLDPRLYSRVDTDTLFYIFYYKQGTYQQYLAAKALKDQSWRFHKQYQTWFQRHEEPKVITEEFEQGTYRFFDYESTWMNRRKADFKFAYKFLEDDV